jgi:NADH-quinone oxidoreductase subunit N
VNTVVSLFYYARVLRAMYLDVSGEAIALDEVVVNRLYAIIAAALVVPTIALGVYWGPVYDFVVQSLATGP